MTFLPRGRIGRAFFLVVMLACAASSSAFASAEGVVLERAARLEFDRAHFAEADSLFDLARAAAEADRGEDAARLRAAAWCGLAEARRALRRDVAADTALARADRLVTALRPSDAALEARVLTARATTRFVRNDPRGARADAEAAVRRADAAEPPAPLVAARARRALGRILIRLDEYDASAALLAAAAAAFEAELGPVSEDLASCEYIRYFGASQRGDYIASRAHAERSLRIREQLDRPDPSALAGSMMATGGAMRNLGDYSGAAVVMRRAIERLRAVQPPNPAAVATSLSTLGGVYLSLRDGDAALRCWDETIAIRDSLWGPGRGEELFISTYRGRALLLLDQPARARDSVRGALARFPEAAAQDRSEGLSWLSVAEFQLGERDSARAHLDQALALSTATLGAESPRTLALVGRSGALDYLDGRRADALGHALALERIGQTLIAQSTRALSEDEALGARTTVFSGIDVLVALASDSLGLDDSARRDVLDAVIRSRISILDRISEERQALPRDDVALAPLVRELEESRSRLARAQVGALTGAGTDSAAVAAARSRRDAAERALAERSEGFRRDASRLEAGFAEVRTRLPAGSALVSFIRVASPLLLAREDDAALKMCYVAFVSRPERDAPEAVALGSAGRIEDAVRDWLAAASTPPPADRARARAAEGRVAALGRDVRRLAWDPLASRLDGATTVFVVPDAGLHGVNFAALPVERATGSDTPRYLAEQEGLLLATLTAERDLLPAPGAHVRGDGLLALGGVDFDHVDTDSAPVLVAQADFDAIDGPRPRGVVPAAERTRFAPLPATRDEVEALAARWPVAAGPAMVRLGAAATEEAFKRDAPGRRVLHLATHGYVLGESPAAGAPGTTRGIGGVIAAGAPRPSAPASSARLAGLALAGANRAAEGDSTRDDGYLTAGEIGGLDLRSASGPSCRRARRAAPIPTRSRPSRASRARSAAPASAR